MIDLVVLKITQLLTRHQTMQRTESSNLLRMIESDLGSTFMSYPLRKYFKAFHIFVDIHQIQKHIDRA